MLVGRPQPEIKSRSEIIRAAFVLINTPDLSQKLFERQVGICLACEQVMQSSDSIIAQIDHATSVYIWSESFLPVEEAAQYANDDKNLVLLHVRCNSIKNATDLEEFYEDVQSGKVDLIASKLLTPEEMERLKQKDFEQRSAGARKRAETMGPEKLSATAKKRAETMGPERLAVASKKGKETMGPEGRSAASRKRIETMGPERRSSARKKQAENMGPERISAAMKKRAENMGPERLSAVARKRCEMMGPARRSAAKKKRDETMGPERRSAASKKAMETMGPERRSMATRNGAHNRYHAATGVRKAGCIFCEGQITDVVSLPPTEAGREVARAAKAAA